MNKKANKIWTFFLSFLWALPLVEIRSIKEKIHLNFFGYKLNGIIVILIYLIIFFIITLAINYKKIFLNINTNDPICLLLFFLFFQLFSFLIRFINQEYTEKNIVQLLWIIVPIIFSYLYIKIIEIKRINIKKILLYGINFYLIFVIVIIAINFIYYKSDFIYYHRIISPGGGPVILGYSILLILCAYTVIAQKNNKIKFNINFWFVIITSSLGIFLTGSRGGMWPLLLLLIFILYYKNKKNFIILLPIFLLVFSFSFSLITDLVPRFLETKESGRIFSFVNSLKAFSKFDVISMVFGKGISNFFPYYNWLNMRGIGDFLDYNTFMYENIELIVQPHNTYIYILLECGIIGLFLFIFFISVLYKKIFKNKSFFNKFLFIVFLIICFIESTLIIQPGVASLWLIMICLISKLNDVNSLKQNENMSNL